MVLDAHFLHLGFSPLTTSHIATYNYPIYSFFAGYILVISSIPGVFLCALLGDVLSSADVWSSLAAYLSLYGFQIIIYWYLGKICVNGMIARSPDSETKTDNHL